MRFPGALALPLPILLSLGGAAAAAPELMSREEILSLGASAVGYSYYWGHGSWRMDGASHGSCTGSCPDCSHSGSYGADCSGFVAKAWQVPGPSAVEVNSHPYSTYNFRYESQHWERIERGSTKPADALVHNDNGSGHIVLYERDDPWGSFWAYEARGCSYGIVHNVRTANSTYVAIRRDNLGTPAPVYEAAAGASSGDLTMTSGEEAVAWFELVNQGNVTWSMDATRLGTQSPQDRESAFFVADNWLAPNRATGADHSDYGPGATGRFTFAVRAPDVEAPTTFAESFQLLQEGVTWFGPVVTLTITVNPLPDDGALADPDESVGGETGGGEMGELGEGPGEGSAGGLAGACAVGGRRAGGRGGLAALLLASLALAGARRRRPPAA